MARLLATFLWALVLACALPSAARAAATDDLRGTWDLTCSAGCAEQTHTIDAHDKASGAFSGNGGSNSGVYTWSINGTLNGNQVTFTIDYADSSPASDYVSNHTATLSSDGRKITGTFTDNYGHTDTDFEMTRLTGPPDDPPAGPGPDPSNPSPEEPEDKRRPTAMSLVCNRGPQPTDNATCIATVADSGPPRNADGSNAAVTPTGLVNFKATRGGVAPQCSLVALPNTPGSASCSATYTPPWPDGHPAATSFPVTAEYAGSAVHRPVSLKHRIPGERDPDMLPQQPIVCGPAPLPSCEGLLPELQRPAVVCGSSNVLGPCDWVGLPTRPAMVCGPLVGAIPRGCAGLNVQGKPQDLETVDIFIPIQTGCGVVPEAGVPHPGSDCLFTVETSLTGSNVRSGAISALLDDNTLPGLSAAEKGKAIGATSKVLELLTKVKEINYDVSSAARKEISKLSRTTDEAKIAKLARLLQLAASSGTAVGAAETAVIAAVNARASARPNAVFEATNRTTDAFGSRLIALAREVDALKDLVKVKHDKKDFNLTVARKVGQDSDDAVDKWAKALKVIRSKLADPGAAVVAPAARRARLPKTLPLASTTFQLQNGRTRALKLTIPKWARAALRKSRKPVKVTVTAYVLRGATSAKVQGTVTLRVRKKK